jgi:hypothetical protein
MEIPEEIKGNKEFEFVDKSTLLTLVDNVDKLHKYLLTLFITNIREYLKLIGKEEYRINEFKFVGKTFTAVRYIYIINSTENGLIAFIVLESFDYLPVQILTNEEILDFLADLLIKIEEFKTVKTEEK